LIKRSIQEVTLVFKKISIVKKYPSILYALIVLGCMVVPPQILQLLPSKLDGKLDSYQTSQVPVIRLKPGSVVPASQSFVPNENNNFYFLTWIKLKELPRDGASFGIFEKIDADRRNRNGYSLSIKRYGEEVRPEVYWRNDEGRGRVYTFAPIKILPGNWTMLLLSFRRNSQLSLHAASGSEGDLIHAEFLGGYEFELPPLIPHSLTPIRLSNMFGQKFNGSFGPVGIFSGGSSNASVLTLVDQILSHPVSPPRSFKKSAIMYWQSE